MDINTVKWGILGTSYISEVMARAIQASSSSKLCAVSSRAIEKAEQFAEQFSIDSFYDDANLLLANPEIDAVYIGLPNHLHKEWVIKAAEAGKHILCEKPFALTAAETKEAFAAVEKAGVFCMEALMYRHHPLTQKLVEMVRNKKLGELKNINAIYTADIEALANKTAGGAIRNLGCYPVSLIRLLAQAEPETIQADGNINHATMIMNFANQLTATVETADNIKKCWQFDVQGTNGSLKLISNPWMPEQLNNSFCVVNGDQVEEVTVDADKPLYTYQIDVMNQMISEKTQSESVISYDDSLGNVMVLEKWQNMVTQVSYESAV